MVRKTKGFKKLCKKTQKQLIPYLVSALQHFGYENIIQQDGFIYAKGDVPVLLTAHMDTVHKIPVQTIVEYINKDSHLCLSSPQGIGGDDRCGIYMILNIIRTHKCSVLFCEDEEIGCVGSRKFCQTEYINDLSDLKYLIELDRVNSKDAVFYRCDNPEFTEFIVNNTGYKKARGSSSDIAKLAPACKIAAVNLSCGYYRAHTVNEYVVWDEMINTIETIKKLLDVECKQFEFIEEKFSYGNYGYGYYNGNNVNRSYYNYSGYGYDYYDDDDYYLAGYRRSPRTDYNSRVTAQNTQSTSHPKPVTQPAITQRTTPVSVTNKAASTPTTGRVYSYILLEIQYLEKIGFDGDKKTAKTTYVQANTRDEAWGKFFKQHTSVCYDDVLDFTIDWV